MKFDISDARDNPIMKIYGGCCQLGLFCPCPCGPCREVVFNATDTKRGNEVGRLTKIIPDPLKWMVADDVDNYEVDFQNIPVDWKALVLAVALFIDFRYFNSRSDKNQDFLHGDSDGWSD
mmetsp:Transcript_28772/g.57489  ORF Transcript_28772/g.57489 Transcript_28772/m.57489 type:complete len:120 (-) Transcript_28772:72-431(-)